MLFNVNRIAPAYLLIGDNMGVVESEAMKIAKMILCEKGVSCGMCYACDQIQLKVHPDVRFVSPDGINIKINQVREVCADSYIKPYSGSMKIFIFYYADKMTDEAGNSFLKTLEEPPGSSVFLLLTSNLDAILPTIRSRCQTIQIENKGFITNGIDNAKRDKIVKLIEDASLDNIETLFSNAKELSKDRENALNVLELAVTWYRENRNFRMIELIEDTKKALMKNSNVELAVDVLLLKRRL